MAFKTTLPHKMHTAQNQRTRRVIAKTMNIKTLTHTNSRNAHGLCLTCHKKLTRPQQILAMGDLSIIRFAGHDYDGTANGLHQ